MRATNTSSVGVRLAAVAFVGTLVLVAPGVSSAKGARGAFGGDVETRIKTLHAQLHIAPEQEAAWKDVAQAMRDNATSVAEARRQQAADEKSASAPDVIDAYAKTMDVHAEAVHKFAAVFQTLYDAMSAAQKKTADNVFRSRVRAAAARRKS